MVAKPTRRRLIAVFIFVLQVPAVAAVIVGAALIYAPAGWIVAGVLVATLGEVTARSLP